MKDPLSYLELTNTEYSLYVTLLKAGRSSANQIIRLSQLHRGTVYDVLKRLAGKGLISHIDINQKRYYLSEKPERLLEIIKEKEKEFENAEKAVTHLIKEISQLASIKKEEHIAQVYEGKKGLKIIMQDLLNVKEFLVLGGEVKFAEVLPTYTKIWASKREQRKIFAKILSTQISQSKWKYNEIKQIPPEYSLPNPTLIYDDKVALILFEETPLSIIVIDSKSVAQTYRNHFNMLWVKTKS